MKIRSTLLAASATAALGLGLMAPATATASTQSPGTTSLAEVLTSDGEVCVSAEGLFVSFDAPGAATQASEALVEN